MIRKRIQKKVLAGASVIAVAFMLMGICEMDVHASESVLVQNTAEKTENDGIMPYSDIIEYRYKVEGTKLYRRLYNYSQECWVGDWEFVGEGFVRPGM